MNAIQRIWIRRLPVLVGTLCLLACSPDVTSITAHLKRPIDIAVVCIEAGEARPAADCADNTSAELVGFVANSERGSLHRIDLRSGKFTDIDPFIPGFSALPVGLRPVAAVASPDGTRIATANTADQSVTVIAVIGLEVLRQELPGRPSDLIWNAGPAGEELLVALPDQGVIARLPIDNFGSLKVLDSIQVPAGTPYDLAASSEGTILFVGHADRALVSIIDLATGAEAHRIDVGAEWKVLTDTSPEPYVAEMIALPEGTPLPACMNGLDDDGDGAVDYGADSDCASGADHLEGQTSASPLIRVAVSDDDAVLYALNTRDRQLVPVDTALAARIDVNDPSLPAANTLYARLGRSAIHLPGVPTDLVIATVEGTAAGESVAVRRAYVGSTTGEVYVFDVDEVIKDKDDNESLVTTHRSRDGNTTEESRPSDPLLFDQTKSLPLGGNRRPDYPSFGAYARTGEGNDFGIQIGGDPRLEVAESWTLTHQGKILTRTNRLAALDATTGLIVTPEPVFCSAGVEVGDLFVARFPSGLECGTGGEFTAPTVDGATKTYRFRGKAFAWKISSVTEQRIGLAPGSGFVFEAFDELAEADEGKAIGDIGAECFGASLRYEVRVPENVYAVAGTVSGYLHGWRAASDGSCVLDQDPDSVFVGRAIEWKQTADVLSACPIPEAEIDAHYEGAYFQNHAFKLRIIPGCDESGKDAYQTIETGPGVRWSFFMESGVRQASIGAQSADEDARVSMATPRSLRWDKANKRIYIVDSGQEQIIGVEPGPDKVRDRFQ